MYVDIKNLNKFLKEKLLVVMLVEYKTNSLKSEGQDTFLKI